MDELRIAVELTAEQRALLLECAGRYFDEELVRLVSLVVQRDQGYELRAFESELDDLIEQLSMAIPQEPDPRRQQEMDALADYLDSQLPSLYDEMGIDLSEHSHNTGELFLMRVELADGDVWRMIAIRGGQTLHDLHEAIFVAFEREEEHLYSFYLPPKKVKNLNLKKLRDCTEYTHPFNAQEQGDLGPRFCSATETQIESLDLKPGQTLFYLFDFGDEWWHRITLERIEAPRENEEYPQIVAGEGESPPQYEMLEEDWEEDEEWEEEDDQDEEWNEEFEDDGEGEFDLDDERE